MCPARPELFFLCDMQNRTLYLKNESFIDFSAKPYAWLIKASHFSVNNFSE